MNKREPIYCILGIDLNKFSALSQSCLLHDLVVPTNQPSPLDAASPEPVNEEQMVIPQKDEKWASGWFSMTGAYEALLPHPVYIRDWLIERNHELSLTHGEGSGHDGGE
jgi:hypothetical protein